MCVRIDRGHFWGHRMAELGAQMLSELAVRQAKAKEKDYKLSDSEGSVPVCREVRSAELAPEVSFCGQGTEARSRGLP